MCPGRKIPDRNAAYHSLHNWERSCYYHDDLLSFGEQMENSAGKPPTKEWAVLVYVAADVTQPGMHRAALGNLYQMVDTGSSEQVYVAAQVDMRREPTWRYVFPPRPAGKQDWEVLPTDCLANVDSADPRSILDFFQWGISTCPAKNTMLILWGHGFGLDDYTLKGARQVA